MSLSSASFFAVKLILIAFQPPFGPSIPFRHLLVDVTGFEVLLRVDVVEGVDDH